MLRSTKELENHVIGATDGNLGQVKDLYFDDHAWVVRYLVAETGSWLASRKVLISPMSIHKPDWATRTLPVAITREQVKNCPDVDTDKPVSRQHEMDHLGHYGYPYYWGGSGMWGEGLYPYAMLPDCDGIGLDRAARAGELETYARAQRLRHRNDNPHLRSCKVAIGYHVHATDGSIGHVEDFLIDEETWAVRYVVLNTSNWWVGHKVLIAPQWVTVVSWPDSSVSVDLTRKSVKTAPPFDGSAGFSRELEAGLYRHHGRPGYWVGSDEHRASIAASV